MKTTLNPLIVTKPLELEGCMKAKIVLIVVLVAVISAIHLGYIGTQPGLHLLHQ